VVVPPLGSNTPLWSLTNEFWYYLVFPLVWIAVARSGVKFWVRTAYLVIASAILLLLGKFIAIYFAIWLLGALVSLTPEVTFLQRNTARRVTTATVAGGLLTLLLIVKVRHGWDEIMTDSLVAVVFAVLLYCMKHNCLPSTHATFRRLTAFFADFSYTLYLVHLPPLIFLRACLTYETAWPPVASSWLVLAGIVGGVVLYAYSISLITERQTEPLRRWLSKQFRPTKRQEHQLAPVEVSS
jgi:peptidoglycan/LPS O-acetylase OafA/YrhL